MQFERIHLSFDTSPPKSFTEETAPKWLCEGGKEGSTMCNRWFWRDHVLTLKVGESVDTDFHRITRIS